MHFIFHLAFCTQLHEARQDLKSTCTFLNIYICVFKGALKAITQCRGAVLLLEIHPEVLALQGQTPDDMFDKIESMLEVTWYVPIFSQQKVDRQQPFFNQFPVQQYDVIALTPALQHLL